MDDRGDLSVYTLRDTGTAIRLYRLVQTDTPAILTLHSSHAGERDLTVETLYELWDTPSRNLLWAYTSQDDALLAVREIIADDGVDAAGGLALIRHEPEGSGGVIAADAELAALALRDAPARAIAD